MSELEWQTRKERIDTRLRNMRPAWKIVPFREGLDTSRLHGVAVTEYPTKNGPADNALFVNGQLLGIIEAKKVGVNPQNVLEQAKRYAAGASDGPGLWNGLRVPFLYATNGEIIWFLDARDAKWVSRNLGHFHVADALEELFGRDLDPARKWLLDTPVEKIARLRGYQADCITSMESNLMDGKRQILVAMATGTGKTFTTVASIYRMLESGLAKRILFLVDRKALAAQAVREFAAFNTPQGNKFIQEYEVYSQRFQKDDFGDDDPFDPKLLPNGYLTDPKPGHSFVYVSTIQRMAINLFGRQDAFAQSAGDPDMEDDADRLDIPIHAFDLIIADECHRGYTARDVSLWRDTIRHFDAMKVGLTATPAAHTVAVFGDPVYRYGVDQAVRDGFLVEHEAVKISSRVRMNGAFLKEGELVGKIDVATGAEVLDHLEDDRPFAAEQIERAITVPDSNKKIIEEIAKYAYRHEAETGRFPKILIFAVNDLPHVSHADQLVRICREVFNQGDGFVQKITGSPSVDRPLQRIREFRNRPNPKVVVTVDMLSTGVDIPALEFIVFLRPVKSRILWEQMLGRGTRKCEAIHKSHFTIFDCFDGTLIDYFKDASNFKIEPPGRDPVSLPQVIENIWQNVDRAYHVNVLVKRLRRIEKDMSGNARTAFTKWIPEGDVSKYADGLPAALKSDFTGAMKLLRDAAFQELLQNYERAKAIHWVGYEEKDEVGSTVVEDYGRYKTSLDYLEAFSRFVKENRDKVEALGILLNRPKDWQPKALDELQQVLARNEFDVNRLQKAHEKSCHKALADIISMVKHAAKQQDKLLTARERVDRAMAKVAAGKTFTDEQRAWLGYFAEHLVESLTLSEEDFDLIPVFTQVGGVGKARRVFRAELKPLIDQINLQVAATA